jgi:hypothetical protein
MDFDRKLWNSPDVGRENTDSYLVEHLVVSHDSRDHTVITYKVAFFTIISSTHSRPRTVPCSLSTELKEVWQDRPAGYLAPPATKCLKLRTSCNIHLIRSCLNAYDVKISLSYVTFMVKYKLL